jgi:hypothetical protein
MSWMKVTIVNDRFAADAVAAALMNDFMKSYLAAGMPKGAAVYHRHLPAVGHAYYFSPEASKISTDVLAQRHAVALSSRPDLADLKPIAL